MDLPSIAEKTISVTYPFLLELEMGPKNGHENCQFYPLECKLTLAYFILGTQRGNLASIRKLVPLKNKKVHLLIFIFGTPFLYMGY